MWQCDFDSPAVMQEAMQTAEVKAVTADAPIYAIGRAVILHYAV